MVADLSTYILDPFVGSQHGTLSGLSLPSLTSGDFYGVVGRDGLATQAQWDYHETLRTDKTIRRTNTLQIQTETNIIRSNARKAQQCADTMHKIAHGIWGLDAQDRINNTNRFGWEITAASGTTVTLRRRSGDPDPNAISMSILTVNGDWVPGSTNRYTTTNSTVKLPAHGILTVRSPSKLSDHAGWIVDRISCPSTVGTNDTFTVYLKTPIGSAATQTYDSADTSDIVAYIEFYVSGWGPDWVNVQDESHLFCEPTSKDIALPATQNFTLESAARIKVPAGDNFWFRCYARWTGSTIYNDLTATAIGQVKVQHQPANSYISKCDLSAVDLSAYDNIRFIYWKESTNAAAQPCGHSRCQHMNRDFSNSVYDSTIVDSGQSWNCTNPTGCDATPRIECYDNTASGFAVGTISNTVDQETWKQIHNEFFYYDRQAAAGLVDSEVIRAGCPSLAMLAGLDTNLPGGYHALTSAINPGGVQPVDTSGDLIVVNGGYEQEWGNADTYGPAGNNITRTEDIGTGTAGFLTKSMATGATPDFDPYNFAVMGNHGRFQIVKYLFKLAFPRVDTGAATQEKNGIILTIGYWDGDRNEVEDPNDATYFWKVQLPQNQSMYDRKSRSDTWGGDILSSTVSVVTDNMDGTFIIEPRNQTITAGSINPDVPTTEIVSVWASGGTNVATDHHSQRVNNYLNTPYRYRGALRAYTAWPGCCIKLTDDTFPDNIRNKKFWITAASAHTGSTQSWIPGSLVSWDVRQSYFPYVLFGNPLERVKTISVQRASATITLSGGEGFPFPLELDKDTYGYFETNTEAGERVLIFKFSPENMTTDTADKIFGITVTTELYGGDGSTYDTYSYEPVDITSDTVEPRGVNADGICNHTITVAAPTIVSMDVIATRPDPASSGYITTTLTQVGITSSYSELGPNEWTYIELASNSWAVLVSACHVGSSLQFRVTTSASFVGGESDFYNGAVLPHATSLPTMQLGSADYDVYGCKGDQLTVVDEGGILDSIKATLVGKEITMTCDGVAHYSVEDYLPVVKILNGETATDLTESTDYDFFGASGEIWGKIEIEAETGTTIVQGDSLLFGMYMADRASLPKSNMSAALRLTLENMVAD